MLSRAPFQECVLFRPRIKKHTTDMCTLLQTRLRSNLSVCYSRVGITYYAHVTVHVYGV